MVTVDSGTSRNVLRGYLGVSPKTNVGVDSEMLGKNPFFNGSSAEEVKQFCEANKIVIPDSTPFLERYAIPFGIGVNLQNSVASGQPAILNEDWQEKLARYQELKLDPKREEYTHWYLQTVENLQKNNLIPDGVKQSVAEFLYNTRGTFAKKNEIEDLKAYYPEYDWGFTVPNTQSGKLSPKEKDSFLKALYDEYAKSKEKATAYVMNPEKFAILERNFTPKEKAAFVLECPEIDYSMCKGMPLSVVDTAYFASFIKSQYLRNQPIPLSLLENIKIQGLGRYDAIDFGKKLYSGKVGPDFIKSILDKSKDGSISNVGIFAPAIRENPEIALTTLKNIYKFSPEVRAGIVASCFAAERDKTSIVGKMSRTALNNTVVNLFGVSFALNAPLFGFGLGINEYMAYKRAANNLTKNIKDFISDKSNNINQVDDMVVAAFQSIDKIASQRGLKIFGMNLNFGSTQAKIVARTLLQDSTIAYRVSQNPQLIVDLIENKNGNKNVTIAILQEMSKKGLTYNFTDEQKNKVFSMLDEYMAGQSKIDRRVFKEFLTNQPELVKEYYLNKEAQVLTSPKSLKKFIDITEKSISMDIVQQMKQSLANAQMQPAVKREFENIVNKLEIKAESNQRAFVVAQAKMEKIQQEVLEEYKVAKNNNNNNSKEKSKDQNKDQNQDVAFHVKNSNQLNNLNQNEKNGQPHVNPTRNQKFIKNQSVNSTKDQKFTKDPTVESILVYQTAQYLKKFDPVKEFETNKKDYLSNKNEFEKLMKLIQQKGDVEALKTIKAMLPPEKKAEYSKSIQNTMKETEKTATTIKTIEETMKEPQGLAKVHKFAKEAVDKIKSDIQEKNQYTNQVLADIQKEPQKYFDNPKVLAATLQSIKEKGYIDRVAYNKLIEAYNRFCGANSVNPDVQKANQAMLQDFIKVVKTPEELSEAFKLHSFVQETGENINKTYQTAKEEAETISQKTAEAKKTLKSFKETPVAFYENEDRMKYLFDSLKGTGLTREWKSIRDQFPEDIKQKYAKEIDEVNADIQKTQEKIDAIYNKIPLVTYENSKEPTHQSIAMNTRNNKNNGNTFGGGVSN